MTRTFSGSGIYIAQKEFQQILLRGKGDGRFAETVNREISLLPPKDNLRIISDKNFLFAKQSFDQWSLICLKNKDDEELTKIITAINSNDEILASDCSYGQVYFEFSGDKIRDYLNKLTHFDFRSKKFPPLTMAQTLIARIDCAIYNLEDKYLITCNSSYEDYFKKRLQDTIDL
tara:strand:- start:1467 stop:1988 length:522 start_codon:yes stop_codon:yes gene_type:complete